MAPKLSLKQARAAFQTNDFQACIDHCRTLIQDLPESSDQLSYNTHLLLAAATAALGQYAQAERGYRICLELDPANALAWVGLTNLHYEWYRSVEGVDQDSSDPEQGPVRRSERFLEASKQTALLLLHSLPPASSERSMAEGEMKVVGQTKGRIADIIERALTHLHSLPSDTTQFGLNEPTAAFILDALIPSAAHSELYHFLWSFLRHAPVDPGSEQISSDETKEGKYGLIRRYIHTEQLSTLRSLVKLYQAKLESTFATTLKRERTRLSAPPLPILKRKVYTDLASKSPLPVLWNDLLNLDPAEGEQALSEREREAIATEQLTFLRQRAMMTSSVTEKQNLIKSVIDICKDVILLRQPVEVAWFIDFEWSEEALGSERSCQLRQSYCELFPQSSTARAFQLYHAICESLDHSTEDVDYSQLDQFIALVGEVYADNNDSLTAPTAVTLPTPSFAPILLLHRLLFDLYARPPLHDWPSIIQLRKRPLTILASMQTDLSIELKDVRFDFDLQYLQALTHMITSPADVDYIRQASEQISRLQEIDPGNMDVLLAQAFWYSHQQEWSQALAIFEALADRSAEKATIDREKAWCLGHMGSQSEAVEILKQYEDQGSASSKAETRYRIAMLTPPSTFDSHDPHFEYLASAIKLQPSCAPAFTALGCFYSSRELADTDRAQKCFLKAFELDQNEVYAAEQMAISFAHTQDWENLELIGRRVVGIERSSKTSWAWKAIGVAQIETNNHESAIASLQMALRSQPSDTSAWMRLSEAYIGSGRYTSALKTCQHALAIEPDAWLCKYQLAVTQSLLGNFDLAVDSLINLSTTIEPANRVCIQTKLSQIYLERAEDNVVSGFASRAVSDYIASIETALEVDRVFPDLVSSWYCISLASSAAARLSTEQNDWSISVLRKCSNVLQEKGVIISEGATEITTYLSALLIAAQCMQYCSQLAKTDSTTLGALFYHLSAVYRDCAKLTDRDSFHNKAVAAVKLSLFHDPENGVYFNALGNLSFATDPLISQHAYVSAIETDPRSAVYWTNLGLLYLKENDAELARLALSKAQIYDPDYAPAWQALGLLSLSTEEPKVAQKAFLQASSISSQSLVSEPLAFELQMILMMKQPEADLFLAKMVLQSPCSTDRHVKVMAKANMQRLVDFQPLKVHYLQAFALLLEASNQRSQAATHLSMRMKYLWQAMDEKHRSQEVASTLLTLCRCLCHENRSTESSEILAQLRTAFTDMLDSNEEVFDISFAHSLSVAQDDNLDGAIQELEDLADEAPSSEQASLVIALTQLLTMRGSETDLDQAQAFLMDFMSEVSGRGALSMIPILASLGLVTEDQAIEDAAFEDLSRLSIAERETRNTDGALDSLIMSRHLIHGQTASAIRACSAAWQLKPWSQSRLSRLIQILHQYKQLPIARRLASNSDAALQSYTKYTDGQHREASALAAKAVMLSPWNDTAWTTFALSQCH